MSSADSSLPSERITLKEESPDTWWESYVAALEESGLSATSRHVIDVDAEFVLRKGILRAGPPGDSWPPSRTRSGMVMGAVQSGKTASMLAVIAKALDAGVDAIVVLAGTRTALWQQTLSRLVSQLDNHETAPWTRRVLVPSRTFAEAEAPTADLADLYSIPRVQARRAIKYHKPLLCVVMKNVHHLERMATTLHKHVYPTAAQRSKPFHLLVIDDEADDSSVLDAVAETRAAVPATETKQVPRRIADLWERRQDPGQTVHANIFATYVAYTATPQANFLQDPDNPLAPRDFAMSLRTPGVKGSLEPRASTYADPAGLKAWYTGGQIFYDTLSSVPLCRPPSSGEEGLADALRSFFVASAVRLWRERSKMGPATAAAHVFATRAEAKENVSSVASMLIHPSSATEDHFELAARVLAWIDSLDIAEARQRVERGERRLSPSAMQERISEEAPLWREWLAEFVRSSHRVYLDLSLPSQPEVPSLDQWDEIEQLIVDEIVPETRIAVINSDDLADDKPDFGFREQDGGWRAPRNHSTIFVSGNVMARGLTLEGLTTTLFTRHADAPLADTQMQMQRWFGYRGQIIDLCRVFVEPAQLALFRAYHEADEALRREIMTLMDEPGGVSKAVTVVQGRSFAATGKIARVGRRDIWAGPLTFLRKLNSPAEDVGNQQVVAHLFAEGADVVVDSRGERPMGLLLRRDLTLEETADFLDQLTLPLTARDDPELDERRWASLQRHLDLPPSDPLSPLYRGSQHGSVPSATSAIAAYLRTWGACLSRQAPGFVTTAPPGGPWSLLDLDVIQRLQPRFRVAMRFGRGSLLSDGPFHEAGLTVATMDRQLAEDGSLKSSWGSRGAASLGDGPARGDASSSGYPGDEYFDYHARGERSPLAVGSSVAARPPGEPGLVLIHPIAHPDGGASLALGLSVPLGGPDQGAALVGRSDDG